jgi:hypothetical protein
MAASWPDGPYLLHHGQKSPSSPLLKICSHLRLPLAIAGTLVAPPAFSCPFLLSSSPLNSPFYTTPASSFWLSGRKQKLKKNTGTNAAEMISALRAAGRRGGGGGGRAVKEAPTATTGQDLMLADVRAATLPGPDRRSREVESARVRSTVRDPLGHAF